MTTTRLVSTPHGDARLHVDRSKRPVATLVLGHGAGGGVDARDLTALVRALPSQGVSVFRVEQPWRVAGRKVAAAPRILDEAWLAVVNSLRQQTPLVVGG
nr:hydrolase [Actinomycetota bacterium]